MLTEDRPPTAPADDPDQAAAAAWLGISTRTLERHRLGTGRPAGYRLGHKLRFTYAELEAFAEAIRAEQQTALKAKVAERRRAERLAAAAGE